MICAFIDKFRLLVIIIFMSFQINSQHWLPKILWTYWETPVTDTDDPKYHVINAFKINFQAKLPGWEIRHLDKDSMWKWTSQIPSFKEYFNDEAFVNDGPSKRADYLRIALLEHYGGVYSDLTTILTSDFNWLLNIKQVAQVENKNGQSPDVFIIYSQEHGYMEKVFDEQTGDQFLLFPSFENFFIAAKPKSEFIKDWVDFSVKTKIQSWKKYRDSSKSLIIDIANEQNIHKGGFPLINEAYFQFMISAEIVQQRKQRQLDREWNNSLDRPRPLSVRYYNIWVMGSYVSAYKADLYGGVSFLAHSNKKFAQNDFLHQVPFFAKLWHKEFEKLIQVLSVARENFCNKNSYIIDKSILYEDLLKAYPVKFYHNCIISGDLYDRIMQVRKKEDFIKQIEKTNSQLMSQLKRGYQKKYSEIKSTHLAQLTKLKMDEEKFINDLKSSFILKLSDKKEKLNKQRIKEEFSHLKEIERLKIMHQEEIYLIQNNAIEQLQILSKEYNDQITTTVGFIASLCVLICVQTFFYFKSRFNQQKKSQKQINKSSSQIEFPSP